MLPPFIIEQIRKREQQRKQREQPTLEVPVAPPARRSGDPDDVDDDGERGVLIIDLV